MFEAFCRNVDGMIIAVVRTPETLLRVPRDLASRVTILVLPGLLYGRLLSHFRDVGTLAIKLARAQSFSVIGADVMDGVYSVRSSVRRFRLARLIGETGKSSRILGFSWNSSPHADALREMIACRSATLCARDPGSAERLRRAGASQVVDVADLAFLPIPKEPMPHPLNSWLGAQRNAGRVIVAVNANYLLEDRIDQVGVLSQLIKKYVDENVSFVLLAHDSRSDRSDYVLLTEIADSCGSADRVLVLPEAPSPGTVRQVSEAVDFVVTGRMHLVILAATVHTPSVAVSYQGKLRGLYDRLGLDLLVEPDAHYERTLNQQFAHMLEKFSEAAAILANSVPSIEALAVRNLPFASAVER